MRRLPYTTFDNISTLPAIAGTITAAATIGPTGVGATTTAIIGAVTTASAIIIAEGSKGQLLEWTEAFG